MIAFRNDYPLVRFDDGSVMHYDRVWLAKEVVHAAERAGYKKWWLTPHVTESISTFLRREFQGSIVQIDRLEQAVRSVLQVIGYSDVARFFQTLPPPVWIVLSDVARQAGTAYELRFFGLLRERLAAVLDSPARQLELRDLNEAIKSLCGSKYWTFECSILRDEVVAFIRAEIAASKRRDLHLTLR